jgi:hypothetical protein
MKNLADEIKQIYVEMSFSSRWQLIEMYHAIGEKLATQPDVSLQSVSNLSGVNVRHLERSVQFYKRYPSLDLLPSGKAISWHKIVNELLPEHSETPKLQELKNLNCPFCGHVLPIDFNQKG